MQILGIFFCMFRNCKSQPVKVDCEFVKNLRLYLFFLPVELDFEVSAVFFSWKLHSPFTVWEDVCFWLFFNMVLHRDINYMKVITSDLILLQKIFSYYQLVKRLSLCNSAFHSDTGEQDRRSYLYRSPVLSQQPYPRILCSVHSNEMLK